MWIAPWLRGRKVLLTTALLSGLLMGCSGEPPTAPADLTPSLAKVPKPSGGGSGITVSAVDPDTVTTDTILTVRVLGSGFTAGSKVTWALAGVATDAVSTVSPVLFISSGELNTRIAVRRDAQLARYDAVVTAIGGKKGIGIAKLEVVAKPIALPVPGWAQRSGATDVNDQGVIVGWGADAGDVFHPLRWTPQSGGWAVEELVTARTGAGIHVAATDINDQGYIVIHAWTLNPDRSLGSSWYSVLTAAGQEADFDAGVIGGISDKGTVFGSDLESRPAAWRLATPTTWTGPILLPSRPGYSKLGLNVINDEDDIAGTVHQTNSYPSMEWAAVWRYDGNGQWMAPVLVDVESGGAVLAINHSGATAGAHWPCFDQTCTSLPAFWPSIGAPRELLPTYHDRTSTGVVRGMNDANLIVGSAPFKTGKRGGTFIHAVVWRPGSSAPRDLGEALGPSAFSEALNINNAWPAVAVGYTRSSAGHDRATAWIIF